MAEISTVERNSKKKHQIDQARKFQKRPKISKKDLLTWDRNFRFLKEVKTPETKKFSFTGIELVLLYPLHRKF